MTGAQSRIAPVALSAMATMMTTVTAALDVAPAAVLPSGAAVNIPNTTGMAVTGTSMSTAPETAGVRIRLNSAIRADSRNWKSAVTATRVASSAGPPR